MFDCRRIKLPVVRISPSVCIKINWNSELLTIVAFWIIKFDDDNRRIASIAGLEDLSNLKYSMLMVDFSKHVIKRFLQVQFSMCRILKKIELYQDAHMSRLLNWVSLNKVVPVNVKFRAVSV